MKDLVKILKYLHEGNVILRYGDFQAIKLYMEQNKKTLDIQDISFKNIRSNIFEKLNKARNLGKVLSENNHTLVIKHKGKNVLQFGKEANPKISLFITRSRNIEVMSLLELRRLCKTLENENNV